MILTSKKSGPLRGEATLPGDKSISHRAALFASLAEGESRLTGLLRAGVTQAMLDGIAIAGARWRWEGDTLVVQGVGRSGYRAGGTPLPCGNSATTFRLMAGVCAAQPAWLAGTAPEEIVLDGSAQLRRRPMGRVIEPLREMGARIRPLEMTDCAPLGIVPARLHGIEYRMPVASAQVKSAILLAGLSAEGATTVEEPSPSRDHTERFLRSLGVRVESGPCLARVFPIDTPLPPVRLTLPGDCSSAAFLIVAASIVPGSDVLLRGVGLNPRRTGLIAALLRMGARIETLAAREAAGEPVGDLRIRSAALAATTVEGAEVVDMIDEFPVFAVAAAFAEGVTLVRQAAELRHKESDRISVLCGELRKLGVQVEESADGFAIHGPVSPKAAAVQSHGDHRLAMSLAVAGLGSTQPVLIESAECIAESFPQFVPTLNSLGANLS